MNANGPKVQVLNISFTSDYCLLSFGISEISKSIMSPESRSTVTFMNFNIVNQK